MSSLVTLSRQYRPALIDFRIFITCYMPDNRLAIEINQTSIRSNAWISNYIKSSETRLYICALTSTALWLNCRWSYCMHGDVIKWKHFPRTFVRRILRSQRPVTRGLMGFFLCTWINGWVDNREAGDLRFHRAHYDVSVMWMSHYIPHKFMSWA